MTNDTVVDPHNAVKLHREIRVGCKVNDNVVSFREILNQISESAFSPFGKVFDLAGTCNKVLELNDYRLGVFFAELRVKYKHNFVFVHHSSPPSGLNGSAKQGGTRIVCVYYTTPGERKASLFFLQ